MDYSSIDKIIENAFNEGRDLLYEFEVYKILESSGLEVPKFAFIKNPSQVDGKTLGIFHRALVIKVVSPQIVHKQKVGGVKVIENLDSLFVQFVLERMKEEIFSHFPEDQRPEIVGFLLVEFLSFTQALGNEVLIGFKEDSAFGSVLTLSKGGDDAEFFAKYFDPANLFIPPFDLEYSQKMINTLNIRHKFEESGHPEYLELMAKALYLLNCLSYKYSSISPEKPRFIIKAMDINPFVITKDGRFIAVDGFAQFSPYLDNLKTVSEVNTAGMDFFFTPNGIAVVGVSTEPGKYSLGREIANLLHDLGRQDLYFVNAKGGTLRFGDTEYPLFKDIKEIGNNVDLVVYAAPAQFTLEFIKTLPDNGPKAVILISGIPSNIKYAEFEKELDQVIPEGLRIIGPNCMGIFHSPTQYSKGLNTLFIDEKRLEVRSTEYSNTVLLTQSGALAVTEIDKLQNYKLFKAIVSFGNKYNVKISDLLAYFSENQSVDLISLYIEGLDTGEGRRFFELAASIDKPIVVYKSGKTEAGARAAASHTASMSGSYDVFKAACMQSGVILAEKIEYHYDFVKVFSCLAQRVPANNRVAGVVNAGFESTVGADELKNLRQARLSAYTMEKLNNINKYGLIDTSTPFLDITPMADDVMYADFVKAVLEDENVDCLFVAIVPHSITLKTTPDTCRDTDSLANLLVELKNKYAKPIVVSVNAGRHYQDFVSILEENGLPVYTDIRSAIKSLDKFVSYHMKKKSE